MSIVRLSKSDMEIQAESINQLREFFSSLSQSKGRRISYIIHTYGCQLNESDGFKMAGTLDSIGLVAVDKEEDADVIILNTCSVRENADNHLFGNLGILKGNKKSNKDTIIIVCGCMMKVEDNVNKIKKSYPYVDLVFDPQQIHNFPTLLLNAVKSKKQLVDVKDTDYIAEDQFFTIKQERKYRALVPIMYGCNNFCTYCIVPYARGRERSRSFDSIIDELKQLAADGYKEVMLLGQNVNSYNYEGKRFADVFAAACDIEGLSRVRFMSAHPKDLSDEVIEIMATRPNAEKHLHLALQSGSDKVLKRMNRPYKMEQYYDIVRKFRKLVPGGSLSTDIIVGFPGETEEDFQGTLDAFHNAKFDFAYTFQYSKRPGTPAATYEDQVPADVVSERFSRLLEVSNGLAFESNKSKVGLSEEVLIEGVSKTSDSIFTGRTLSNHLVNFTIPEDIMKEQSEEDINENFEGKLAVIKITEGKPFSVFGVLEKFC